jgi:chromosome segregation ATPase
LQQLQRELRVKSLENDNLRATLAEKELLITELSEARESCPLANLDSEIATFAHFSESAVRKLIDARSLTQQERRNLGGTVDRLSDVTAISNPRSKISQFFAAVQSFCDGLVDKIADDGLRADYEMENRQLQGQLAAQADEIADLTARLKSLTTENDDLIDASSSNQRMAKQTMRELSEVSAQSQASSNRLADVSRQYESLRLVYAQLSDDYAAVKAKCATVSDRLASTETALGEANVNLQRASRDNAELSAQVDASEYRLQATSREKERYQQEVSKQSSEIRSLSPLRSQAQKMTDQNAQLRELLATVQQEHDADRQQLKLYKLKAEEAVALREEVAASARELTECHDHIRQATARNRSLTEHSDNLAHDIGTLQDTAEALNARISKLTTENSRLQEIAGEYSSLRATNRQTEDVNRSLADELSTAETDKRKLSAQLDLVSSEASGLQRQVDTLERQNRKLQIELDSQTEAARSAQSENQRLAAANRQLSVRDGERQALHDSVASQLEAKSLLLESINSQVERFRAAASSSQAKVTELEAQNRSLSSQLETKSALLDTQVSRLEGANQDLQDRLARTTIVAEKAKSATAAVEAKSILIDDLNDQIKSCQTTNDELVVKNRRLSQQLRDVQTSLENTEGELRGVKDQNRSLTASLTSELQAKNSLMADLQETNTELSMKLSDLENENEASVSSIAGENRELVAEIQVAQKENRHLTRLCDKLNGQVSDLNRDLRDAKSELDRARRGDKTQHLSNVVEQREDTIRQLRDVVASQTDTIQAMERQLTPDPSVIVGRIENVLNRLRLAPRPRTAYAETIGERLEAILDQTHQIRNMFDEQRRSLDRLTSLTSSQHGALIGLTSGRRSP